jgi:hypothetical protein
MNGRFAQPVAAQYMAFPQLAVVEPTGAQGAPSATAVQRPLSQRA